MPIFCPLCAHYMPIVYLLQNSVEWTLSDASKKIVDARASDIARNSGAHFPPNMEVLGQHSQLKCVVWHRLSACAAWDHLFAGVFPEKVAGPFQRLVQLLKTLHDETSDVSDDAGDQSAREERTRRLTQFAVETLCRLETCLPEQKFTSMLHLLIHLPLYIQRWNNVRNYWCFFMER